MLHYQSVFGHWVLEQKQVVSVSWNIQLVRVSTVDSRVCETPLLTAVVCQKCACQVKAVWKAHSSFVRTTNNSNDIMGSYGRTYL